MQVPHDVPRQVKDQTVTRLCELAFSLANQIERFPERDDLRNRYANVCARARRAETKS